MCCKNTFTLWEKQWNPGKWWCFLGRESQLQKKRYLNLGEGALLRCYGSNSYPRPGSCYLWKQITLGTPSLRASQLSVGLAEFSEHLRCSVGHTKYRPASWILIQMEMKMCLHLNEAKRSCRDLRPQNTQNHLARGVRDVVCRSNDPDLPATAYGNRARRWKSMTALNILL